MPDDVPYPIVELLQARSGRRQFVPLRRAFLQRRVPGGGAGPLAPFVAGRRKRALDLYLLVHALASTEPWDVAMRSRVWSTALDMPDTPASQVYVSKTLTWLEQQKLVRSEKDGTLRRLYLLDERGTGVEYRHPARSPNPDYFKLPYAYWLDGWHARLSLPATSVLLIALSLNSTFVLPLATGEQWYGISRDTLRRGTRDLVEAELLGYRSRLKSARKSPTGMTEERHYSLRGAFASPERRAQRKPPPPRRP